MKKNLFAIIASMIFLGFAIQLNAQQSDQCIDLQTEIKLSKCQYDFVESEGFDYHDEALFDLISKAFAKAKRKGTTNYFRDAGTAQLESDQTITLFDVHNFFLTDDNRLERLSIKRLNTEIDEDANIARIYYQISFIVDGRSGDNCARLKNKFEKKYRVFQHESILRDHIQPFVAKYLDKANKRTTNYFMCN